MDNASWSPQASTHSAHPLHFVGSMNMPNLAGSLPCFSGTFENLFVSAHCSDIHPLISPDSHFSTVSFSRDSGIALPRIAVSGHWVTHSIQATQLSDKNSGMSGAI